MGQGEWGKKAPCLHEDTSLVQFDSCSEVLFMCIIQIVRRCRGRGDGISETQKETTYIMNKT